MDRETWLARIREMEAQVLLSAAMGCAIELSIAEMGGEIEPPEDCISVEELRSDLELFTAEITRRRDDNDPAMLAALQRRRRPFTH